MPLPIIAIFAVPFVIALGAFIAFRFFGSNTIENEVAVPGARGVSAMAALPGGSFVYGDRTGRIFTAEPAADPTREPLAEIAVADAPGAGLIGLAADGTDLYASYISPDGFLTVASVAEGDGASVREIWRGPASSGEGLGGRIAVEDDGDLIVGIGHLDRPDLVTDVSTLNGKFVTLDPEGTPDQLPKVVSGGWYEPVAFAITEAGDLWVMDRAPEDESEIVARGDLADGPDRASGIRDRIVPTGLVSTDAETLVYCSSLNGELGVFKIDGRGVAYTLQRFPTLATDCQLGAVALTDGRLIYSTGEDLRVANAP